MSVGLLCSVIVTQRASDRENDLGGFGKEETTEGKGTHCYENKGTLKLVKPLLKTNELVNAYCRN